MAACNQTGDFRAVQPLYRPDQKIVVLHCVDICGNTYEAHFAIKDAETLSRQIAAVIKSEKETE
jgi:hypothetical protein